MGINIYLTQRIQWYLTQRIKLIQKKCKNGSKESKRTFILIVRKLIDTIQSVKRTLRQKTMSSTLFFSAKCNTVTLHRV